MHNCIDLRSDTVTRPTPEMRRAMAEAEVGDDVYGEDPTTNRLQEEAADIMGKESALFLPTGTMANQVAIRVHTRPGDEVICDDRSHVFNYEMAAMAAISGCLARPIPTASGSLSWSAIEAAISPNLPYRARTGLVVLENTHNMWGGTVATAEQIDAAAVPARGRGLPVHLDGARIFNASVALNTGVDALCRSCDSVMFSLSKGLSAPAGSILAGSRAFIEGAWRVRKMLGGGMRQTGILAAAGRVALQQMVPRLAEDHENARRLAAALVELPEFSLKPELVRTNIVIADTRSPAADLLRRLREQGVLAGATGTHQVRFVTHKDVPAEAIDRAIRVLRRI